jgi:hypothetical protein
MHQVGRTSEDMPGPPARRPSGGRWDEGKERERPADSWRSPLSPPNAGSSVGSSLGDRWNRNSMDERGAGMRPGAAAGGGTRWGEDERERRWGGGRDEHAPPPRREGGWGGPPGERGDREWGRGPPHRPGGDMRGGGGDHYRGDWGGGGGEPAWMHDESGSAAPPPPRPGRGPMTAKDLEAERQQFQAAWKAQQSEKVSGPCRVGLHDVGSHVC